MCPFFPDGGVSWERFETGLTDLRVSALAINPQAPTTVYAGTDYGRVFVRQEVEIAHWRYLPFVPSGLGSGPGSVRGDGNG